jgi:hypothetical protein
MIRLLFLLTLTGCSQIPIIQTVEVQVPIAISCLQQSDIPARPHISSDNALKAKEDYDMVMEAWIERSDAIDYADRLEALLEGCVAP